MNKTRLEAFSDGVIAIIIMVLELQMPHGADWVALRPLIPSIGAYAVSFVFVGIYWSNHHHMMHTVTRVDGKIMWANLHLLFWLSLVPFITGWVGETHFASLPVAIYGGDFLLAAVAYAILEKAIIADQGEESKLANAVGTGIKEKLSVALYIASIPLAYVDTLYSFGCFLVVAMMWLIPDRRIERKFGR